MAEAPPLKALFWFGVNSSSYGKLEVLQVHAIWGLTDMNESEPVVYQLVLERGGREFIAGPGKIMGCGRWKKVFDLTVL